METEPLNQDNKLEFPAKKRRTLLIIIIASIIIIVALTLILYFTLRKEDSDNDNDNFPFNKIIKEGPEIDLIPKSGKFDYIFIFMHGMFGKPEDYIETFNKKDGPIPENFKIILPGAKLEYVTRIGSNISSWFDVLGNDGDVILESDIVFEDLDKSGDRIKNLIREEVVNVNNDYRRIFIGGFSQGACLSFHVGLSFEYTLGGVATFCGIPINKTQIRENREELNILSIAGGKDIYFPLEYLTNRTNVILKNFKNLTLIPFPNEEHAVTSVGLIEVKKFINSLL